MSRKKPLSKRAAADKVLRAARRESYISGVYRSMTEEVLALAPKSNRRKRTFRKSAGANNG